VKYPDIKTYERLYQKYLLGDRSKEMLDLAGDIRDKVFLDICCGGGRLTKEAIGMGTKKNVMIDSAASMIGKGFDIRGLTQVIIMSVEDALLKMRKTNNMVDVAMCQQGINYWLTESKAWQLSLLMPEGGIFIFNTFNKRPSEIPKIREYTLLNPGKMNKSHYVEINWCVKKEWFDVYHVQICQGEEPHFTKFKWMDERYIRSCLKKFFDVELIIDNKTSIYKCIKK